MTAISKQNARRWAHELIRAHNEDYEYSLVYEDEEIVELYDEDDFRAIYDEMRSAKVTVTWDDE